MFKKAFTLIELLVVVLIIGILSAIALPQYTKAVEKARLTEAVSNSRSLRNAIDFYLLENGWVSSAGGLHLSDMGLTTELSGGGPGEYDYETKDFIYNVFCENDRCEVEIEHQGWDYGLVSRKYSVSGEWTNICVTQLTEKGRKMCKNVEGFTYQDQEN